MRRHAAHGVDFLGNAFRADDGWKGPYHHGRAMIEVSERLGGRG